MHPELYFSSTWGTTACDLLPTPLSNSFCHKNETKCWIVIKPAVHGSSTCAGCAFHKAYFVAQPASSFPVMSLGLGIQHDVMGLPWDNIFWHVCKTQFKRGFLLPWLSVACHTDILSENIYVYMWQKSNHFCFNSLNQLFKQQTKWMICQIRI